MAAIARALFHHGRRRKPESARSPDIDELIAKLKAMKCATPTEELAFETTEDSLSCDHGSSVRIDELERYGKSQLCRKMFPADTYLRRHRHRGLQIMYVLSGRMTVAVYNGGDKFVQHEIRKDQSILMQPEVQHAIACEVETVALAFTVPPEKAYVGA